MIIIVCMKIVPSIEDMKFDPVSNTVNREECHNVINPYDLYALAEAVKLKNQIGGKVIVLSMGKLSYKDILKETIALGADEIICVCDKVLGGADTLATSYTLEQAIRKIRTYDLIFCGKQTQDSETSQIGPQLGERLGIPSLVNIKKIDFVSEHIIQCECLTEDGCNLLETSTPCLVTVGVHASRTGTPKLKDIMKAQRAEITVWNAEDIGADKKLCGVSGSPTRVVHTFVPTFQNTCEYVTGNVREQSKQLAVKIVKLLQNDFSGRQESIPASPEQFPYSVENIGSKDYKDVWVYCEVENNTIKNVSLELLFKGRKLADELDVKLGIVVIGMDLHEIVEKLKLCPIDEIIVVENETISCFDEMLYTDIFQQLIKSGKPSIILFGATISGKTLAARIAVRVKTGLTADCTELEIEKHTGLLLQTRTTFGGKLYATIVCSETRPQLVTVKSGVFKAENLNVHREPVVKYIDIDVTKNILVKVVNQTHGRVKTHVSNDIVVSFGRGVSTNDNVRIVKELAELIGADISASRAAVDLGFAEYQCQIGQSGKTVSPKLYIAIGISGALQHLEGMRHSKNIIAINKDDGASIFNVASLGIVADAKSLLPELITQLKLILNE